jgi:hypothetical protein
MIWVSRFHTLMHVDVIQIQGYQVFKWTYLQDVEEFVLYACSLITTHVCAILD